jgi:alkylation response protein AidB-like acyl-CoA dehydrogenase
MGDMGLLGATLPPQYGGAGLNYVSYGLIAREMEYVDSAYRTLLSVQSSLTMVPIYEFGSEEQKQKYLPKLGKGELIGCFGLTEPDSGSDPASATSCARSVPGGWKLSGRKTWITNSPIADIFIVWAKDDEGALRGFILEKGMPGLTTPLIQGKVSLRASITGDIVMDEVFVPTEKQLPAASGLKGPFTCLNSARYGIAGRPRRRRKLLAHGAAIHAGAPAVRRPLAATQLIQKKLVDMQAEIAIGIQGGCASAADGRRQRDAGTRLAAQAQQHRQGAGNRPQRPRHAGRQRHLGRIRRHPAHGQSGVGDDLRGHARRPCADPRPGADRDFGLLACRPRITRPSSPRPASRSACSATTTRSA